MIIETGKYYANDYKIDGHVETNILYVLSKRESTSTEVDNTSYATETMFLENEEFVSIHKNDWMSEFFKRVATQEEIELFEHHRKSNPNLKHYAEMVTDIWLS